jgi:hypothetical protein
MCKLDSSLLQADGGIPLLGEDGVLLPEHTPQLVGAAAGEDGEAGVVDAPPKGGMSFNPQGTAAWLGLFDPVVTSATPTQISADSRRILYVVDSSGGAKTIALADEADSIGLLPGFSFAVKRNGGSSVVFDLSATSDTIDGATSLTLAATGDFAVVVYLGSGLWTALAGTTTAGGGGALTWLGAWSGATAYVVGDAVESGGSSYVCISAHTNQVPPNATYWDLLASRGSDGADGADGVDGPVGATGAAGAGYGGAATDSITIGTGSKVFTTVGAGKAYQAGDRVRVSNDSTHYMEGPVASYVTGTLTVTVDRVVGAGTFSVWNIGLAGDVGDVGATGAPGSTGSTGAAGTTLYDYVDAQTDITGTNAETSLYSRNIGANDLGTRRMMRLVIGGDYLNNSGPTVSIRARVKYGSTTMWDSGAGGNLTANANRRAFQLTCDLVAYNATNAQRVSGLFTIGPPGAAMLGTGAPGPTGAMMAPFLGSAAEDSTSAKTLEVTMQHSSSSGNVSIRLEFARIELCIP